MPALLSLLKTSLLLLSLHSLPHENAPPQNHMTNAFDIIALNQEVNQYTSNINTFSGKHGYFFIGKTGHGKSTTINYLLGNEMKEEIDKNGKIKITSTENDPPIGHSLSRSQTRLVKAYKVKNNQGCDCDPYYFDTPGYDDTSDQPHQVMVRSLAITLAARQANVLGIMVVLDIDLATSTSGRSNDIKEMMDIVLQIFPDVKDRYNTTLYWLCTKMGDKVSKQHIINRLQEIKKDFSSYEDHQMILDNTIRNQDNLILIRPTGKGSQSSLAHIEKKLWPCSSKKNTEKRRNTSHTFDKTSPCPDQTIPSASFKFSMDIKTSLRFTEKLRELRTEHANRYKKAKKAYKNFAKNGACMEMIKQSNSVEILKKSFQKSLKENEKAQKRNIQKLEKVRRKEVASKIAKDPTTYRSTTIKYMGRIGGMYLLCTGGVFVSIGALFAVSLFTVLLNDPLAIIFSLFPIGLSSVGSGAMYGGWNLWDTWVQDGKAIQEAQTIKAEGVKIIENIQCIDNYMSFTSKEKSFCESDQEIHSLKGLVELLELEDYRSLPFLDIHAGDNAYFNIFCQDMDNPASDSAANKEEL